jgi:hypothetical protein
LSEELSSGNPLDVASAVHMQGLIAWRLRSAVWKAPTPKPRCMRCFTNR